MPYTYQKYLLPLALLVVIIIIVYWLLRGRSASLIEAFNGDSTSVEVTDGVSNVEANQMTKEVEQLLRNFENNYRVFVEDNQRLAAMDPSKLASSDYAAAQGFLVEVKTRNNIFLADLAKIRNLESYITKAYGSPLFANILEKVTQAETLISTNNNRIRDYETYLYNVGQQIPPPVAAVTTTVPVASVTTQPVVAVTQPAATVTTQPVASVTTPVVVTDPVAVTTAPVAAVTTAPVAAVTTPVVVTDPGVGVVATTATQALPPVALPVTQTEVIGPNGVAQVTSVGLETPSPGYPTAWGPVAAINTQPALVEEFNPGWPNQIPIIVPGQVVSQIPNPIVPSRFNNFATESRALTAAASTMGAVEIRPDRINCLSSMQYFAPISSPGYPPPQPVISGSY
jgi:hypothetical protein